MEERERRTADIPRADYWQQRLKCHGCDLPLVPPVHYCQNAASLHPLCHYCAQCSQPNCGAKIGTSRCFIIEKILVVSQFKCEFTCSKGPFSATEYRVHIKRCHFRPIRCTYCGHDVPFRKYLDHLIKRHNVPEREMLEGTNNFCFTLAEGLPKVQYHRLDDSVMLFRYENSKFWVELLSDHEEMEADYFARVQGLKYDIDTKLQCLSPRNGYELVTSSNGYTDTATSRLSLSSNSSGEFRRFINPAIDEQLYVAINMEDDNSISSMEYFDLEEPDEATQMPTYVRYLMKDLSYLLEEKRSSMATIFSNSSDLRKVSEITSFDETDSDADSVFHIGSLFASTRTLNHPLPEYTMSPELKQKNRIKREHIVAEIIDTERSYVEAMNEILTGYGEETTENDPELLAALPEPLRKYAHKTPAPITDYGIGNLTLSYGHILFGNLKEIHQFHAEVFLPNLEVSLEAVELIGDCFIQHNGVFLDLYSRYCQMIPVVGAVQKKIGENHPWLEMCRKKLNHRLPLDSYLMKPVQRITKYQLLLKDLIKCSEDCPGYPTLLDALDQMLAVLRSVDESMLQSNIVDCPFPLHEEGILRLQAPFLVWTEQDRYRISGRPRHLFLYPKSILVCKKERDLLHFKSKINLFEYGLTETPAGENSDLRFELWTQRRTKTYLFQAETTANKQQWVSAINQILMEQLHAAAKSRKQSTLSATRSLSFSNINHVNNNSISSNGITMNVLESL